MKWLIIISVLFSICIVESSLPPNSEPPPEIIDSLTLEKDNVTYTCIYTKTGRKRTLQCNGIKCEYLYYEGKRFFWLCRDLILASCPKRRITNVIVVERKIRELRIKCWGKDRGIMRDLRPPPP